MSASTKPPFADEDERLRSVLQNMPVMLDAFDDRRLICVWNRECERVTGFRADEVIGNPDAMSLLYPDRAYRERMLAEWAARGNDYRNWRWDITCKDGTKRTIEWSNLSSIHPLPGWAAWGVGVDVTDRVALEQALLTSEQRHALVLAGSTALALSEAKARAVFDQTFEFIGLLDTEGTVLEANQTAMRFAGVSASDVIGRPFWETPWWVHSVVEQERLRLAIRQAAAGEFVRFETTHADPSGALRIIDFSLKPVRGEGAEVRWLVPEGRDVTEQRQAEAARRVGDTLFRQAIEASPVPSALNDDAQRITYVNPAFTRVFGYDRGDIPTLAEWWPRAYPDPVYRQSVIDTWQAGLDEAQRKNAPFEALELRLRCKDGSERIAVVGAAALPGAGAGTHLVTLFDITERKLAEDERAAAQAETRRAKQERDELIASVDGIVWESNAEPFEFTFVSARAERLLGYPVARWLESPTFWADHIHEEDRERVVKDCRRFVAARQDHTLDYRMVAADGRVLWLHDVVTVGIADGEPVKLRGIMVDITAAKEAVAARQVLEAQLGQAQKMEAIGTLAAGIAHDFNNILAAMFGNVALVRGDIGPDHPASESVDQLQSSALRAAALVRQILSFGRPRSPGTRAVDVRETIEADVQLLRATIPSNVEIRVHLEDTVPAILGNPTDLSQVLVNLCTNAWHAMERQGGCIEVILDDVTSTDSDAEVPPGRYARLVVRDNGIGMDAATLDRIYDPFFTTKEVGRGTGLGLAIVQRIVADLAGTIKVTSTPGAGTTFTLYFPAHDRGSRVESATAARSDVGRGEHVLFLDDEPALVNVGKRILERAGYRVTGFTSVAAALESLRGRPCAFDIVMTDFNMPGASGVDVARQVSKEHPDLPIVLLSGVLSESVEGEAHAAGVHHVVGKPYGAEQLPAAVALVLGEARRHGVVP